MEIKSKRSFVEVLSESIVTGASDAYSPHFKYRRDIGIPFEIATMRRVSIKNRIYHAAHALSAAATRPFYYILGQKRREK